MGKSGKKTKSDRINSLRKQYDAFLDEDKKRKDRNELILGSLEKMRLYTPAVLPLRHIMGYPQINKYHVANQERPEYLRKVKFDNNTLLRSRHIDISLDCVTNDEEILLQEIAKKYILIPKLPPKNENPITYYNPPNANNDTDWRNKYNILDELKKIEKEGSSEISINKPDITCNNYNDHVLSNPDSISIKEQKQTINIGQSYDSQQNEEIPPITELRTNNTNAIGTNNLDYNVDCKTNLECNQNITSDTDFGNEVILSLPKLNSIKQEHHISDSNKLKEETPRVHVMIAEERNDNKMDEKLTYNHVQDISSQNEMKTRINDIIPTNTETVINEPVTQNNTLELSSTENEDSNNTVNLNDKQNIELHLEKDEIVTNVVENMENEELCANIGQDEEQITQENEPTNETTIIDDNIISSQIEEFDTEQKEMFYSNEVEYNQNVEIMGNNAQSEGYTNEQYEYYNESQQDQPYYAEINEHEESTQRYDPNYEQQYAENYDHANVAQYENQQYAVDNETQEVTNISYEPQPQQEVTNVNYEQPYQQEVTTENFEQQPVNYEYEHSGNLDNPDQHHGENTNMYDGQASEHINYENQQYDEMDEVEHPTISDQNVYQSQEDYVQNTDHESTQNLEEQLHEKEGYRETKNSIPNEPATEVETIKMESNIKVT